MGATLGLSIPQVVPRASRRLPLRPIPETTLAAAQEQPLVLPARGDSLMGNPARWALPVQVVAAEARVVSAAPKGEPLGLEVLEARRVVVPRAVAVAQATSAVAVAVVFTAVPRPEAGVAVAAVSRRLGQPSRRPPTPEPPRPTAAPAKHS